MPAFGRSLKEIFFFSLPIIAGQLGQMLFGIGDIVVAGRYSTEVLSALGIATAIFSPFLLVGTGITFAVSPLKARMIAQNRDVGAVPGTTLALGFASGTVLALMVVASGFCVKALGLAPAIEKLVVTYLMICAGSMIPVMIFQVLKENLQAREKTLFANSLILFFNLVNVGANVFFIFTLDWGIAGAAVATTLSRTLMAVILYAHAARELTITRQVSLKMMGHLLKKGLPIGLNGLLIGLIFSLVTVLAGKMSVTASAANNILINISSLTYMVPYALAGAASVKIAGAFGRRDFGQVTSYALATLCLGLMSASAMGFLFYAVPESILSLATTDSRVIRYGVSLLLVGAVYQVPDAVQVTIQGCLRGLEITFRPMVTIFLGIWGMGFPFGCFFAYVKGLEAAGLWMGMAAGLTAVALVNSFLFVRVIMGYRNSSVSEPQPLMSCATQR
ncbi:MATE family efflux transporter [Desulfoluna spongiiphila]|uniref:Multidrug resistance protein, MATE family n=1 Tax=Desulfoluna spongiiphila TaxID=419481 RepID=A0A1G5H8N4_9BACT|nr:MATE family efflux transporter [Desulfoluna spongiiphila]SCY60057.1 multidrug resistance protein, MATE family [Desulfoluna spongiiphila]